MSRDRSCVSRIPDRTAPMAFGVVLLSFTVLLFTPSLVLAQDPADHVLISAFMAGGRSGMSSAYVELHNPTDEAIDLSDVYLSTAQDGDLGQNYWNIVTGEMAGGGTGGNVHARFPANLTIAAGGYLNIALVGSAEFEDEWEIEPDLELYEDASEPDHIPNMREAFPGSIGAGLGSDESNDPAMVVGSGGFDSIVVYRWDGESDLVEDVDYVFYGSSTRPRADKSGVGTYLNDTPVGDQISLGNPPSAGQTYRRNDAVESGETATGGNGVTGHDETSEDLATSWGLVPFGEEFGPVGPPAPAFPQAPIVTAGEIGPSYSGIPTSIAVTVALADGDDVAGMVVHYRVDGGDWQDAAGSTTGDDIWSVDIPGQNEGVTLEWSIQVTGTDEGVAFWPAGGDHLPTTTVVVAVPAPEITSATASGALVDLACTITVLVDAVDLDLSGTLYYAVGDGVFDSVPMVVDGTVLTGDIPGQPTGTMVRWYVVVEDDEGRSDTYPEGAPDTTEEVTFTEAYLGAAKLLITEINTGENIYPFEGMHQIAPEFIEIHNPNAYAVNLSDYYLTDAINYNYSTQLYWYIATVDEPTQQNVGGGHYNDFTARFPDGFIIQREQTVVVSMASSGRFEDVYGQLPDLEMYADSESVAGVPTMRPVFDNPQDDLPGNSIYTPDRPYGGSSDELPKGIPEMEEHYGEPLILYHWAQGDPIVTDIDIFIWGEAKTGDYRVGFDKSEEPGYQPDTPVADQDWFTDLDETGLITYTRIDAGEGTQVTEGSNGVDGRDETSENLSETFAQVQPTPGIFFAGLEPSRTISLTVPARTFLPSMGETFPIEVVSAGGSETKLRIFDVEGRLVITLWDSRFNHDVSTFPDFPTTVEWDGRSDTYERLRAGMYIVHLQAVDIMTGETTVKTAPVVIATRLQN